jgi:cell division protein FtsL
MDKAYLTIANPSFWGYFWGFVSVILPAIIICVTALVIAFAGRRFLSIDYRTIEKIEKEVANEWRRKEAEREARNGRKRVVPLIPT